ncbi:MAG: aa3-type cytochrome oxidase subunit IV, partial [Pseudonocardiaceae bacterium]
MKVEARIFEIITAFFFLSAVIYGLWSHGEAVG